MALHSTRSILAPKSTTTHVGGIEVSFIDKRAPIWKPKRDSYQKIRRHRCEFCQDTFIHNNSRTRHIRERHNPDGKKPKFTCPEEGCSAAYARIGNLEKHVRERHEEQAEKVKIWQEQHQPSAPPYGGGTDHEEGHTSPSESDGQLHTSDTDAVAPSRNSWLDEQSQLAPAEQPVSLEEVPITDTSTLIPDTMIDPSLESFRGLPLDNLRTMLPEAEKTQDSLQSSEYASLPLDPLCMQQWSYSPSSFSNSLPDCPALDTDMATRFDSQISNGDNIVAPPFPIHQADEIAFQGVMLDNQVLSAMRLAESSDQPIGSFEDYGESGLF